MYRSPILLLFLLCLMQINAFGQYTSIKVHPREIVFVSSMLPPKDSGVKALPLPFTVYGFSANGDSTVIPGCSLLIHSDNQQIVAQSFLDSVAANNCCNYLCRRPVAGKKPGHTYVHFSYQGMKDSLSFFRIPALPDRVKAQSKTVLTNYSGQLPFGETWTKDIPPVVWHSSDSNVISFVGNNHAVATGVGTATIRGEMKIWNLGRTPLNMYESKLVPCYEYQVQVVLVDSCLMLRPEQLTVTSGMRQQLSARWLVDGHPLPVAPSVPIRWSVDDATVGAIDQNGLFQARSEGTVWVHAESGNRTSSVQLEVVPPVYYLFVDNPDSDMRLGSSRTLTLRALKDYGDSKVLRDGVAWQVNGKSLNIDPKTGMVTAKKLGTSTVEVQWKSYKLYIPITVVP